VESIGERLRTARESRKLSIREIVKETNISPLYIEALEDEDFDKFPSETYIIGFLRSYAEFLKLDANEMIMSYRGYKIGESATPLEELTKPTRAAFSMTMSNFVNQYRNIIFIAGVAFTMLLIIWGIKSIFSSKVDIADGDSIDNIKSEYNAKNIGNQIENIRNLQLHNEQGIVLVYKNEAVQFLVDNKEVVFLLKEIQGEAVEVEILPAKQILKLEMGKVASVRVQDSPRDVNFTLKGLTENRAKIMVELGAKVVTENTDAVKDGEKVMEANVDNTSVIAQNPKSLKIVFEAEFTQKSFVEVYLDGNKKSQGFVTPGTRERYEASEFIQIKVGNAGGLKAIINGREYSFGKSGQVANKVITWKKDVANPNLYHIVIKDW
jgi:cytoskeletal protein RodZ